MALQHQLGATLLVSTYQANKLLAVRATGGDISTHVRKFDNPIGFAVDSQRLAIGTRKEVWFLRKAPYIAPRIEPAGQHDACLLPRIRMQLLADGRFPRVVGFQKDTLNHTFILPPDQTRS